MSGRLNAYYCPECQGYIVTRDVDEGVTPMLLACRVKGDPRDPANDCKGTSRSMGYPRAETWPIPRVPTWEWFRPEGEDYLALSEEMRDHVDRGGLHLRRIEAA